MTFEVSDPTFQVDGDLNVVPHEDVLYSGPVLFIHGTSAHADDMAEVEITGQPNTLRVSRNYVCVCFISFFIYTLSKLKRLCFIKY